MGGALRSIGTMAAIALAILPFAASAAQSQKEVPALRNGTVMEAVERLKPGEFLWMPEIAPQGPVLVVVSLATQRAVVYRNGIPIGVSTVSTGKAGHETPTGVFTILQKKVEHYSNLYDDAPMPFMQRLTWDGVALHAGRLPGYPASHGCIRLPLAFAKLLYGVTRLGLTVVVTDQAAVPRIAPEPSLFEAADAREPSGRGMTWQPEVSPTGPVAIVVSAADRRAIVLRNGKQIGSAPVDIAAPVKDVSAYSLVSIGPEGWKWMRLQLPGQDGTSTSYRGKFRMTEAFRQAVMSVLGPGTTVVITADSLRAGRAGAKLDIQLAEPENEKP